MSADLLTAIRAIVREESRAVFREELARAKTKPKTRRTRSLVSAAALSATVVPASELDMARARAMQRRLR